MRLCSLIAPGGGASAAALAWWGFREAFVHLVASSDAENEHGGTLIDKVVENDVILANVNSTQIPPNAQLLGARPPRILGQELIPSYDLLLDHTGQGQ